MVEKVALVGLKRKSNYLYNIDEDGDIVRLRQNGKFKGPVVMARDALKAQRENVLKTGIKRDSRYIYFLDPEGGDVSRMKIP